MHWPFRLPLEAVLWTAGLVALACTDPAAEGLFSLCPLEALDFSFCPGCGLGHAIAYLFRGEWLLSLQTHPLGLPVLLVLVGRIGVLVRQAFRHPPSP